MIQRRYVFPGVLELNYQARRRMGVNIYLIDGGTEFALIEVLMRRAGSIVPRDTLTEAGWGLGADVNDSTLYVFIRALRAKIAAPGEPQLLHTARGVGYTLRPATH